MNKYFDLSVHELVDFVLRKGSIDERIFNSKAMQEGTKLHHSYQNAQDTHYISEVNLSSLIIFDTYKFFLHGRCDGIIKRNNEVTIDEIKTCHTNLDEFFEENKEWHLGQAECYAYLYCLTYKINEINVSLTYISQENNSNILVKKYSYTLEDLEIKINSYLEKYIEFIRILDDINKEKQISLENVSFPFENLRKGQEELIEFCKKIIDTKDVGFIEASTGCGKTISTIYPTLFALKDEKYDKFFYLTAKNSGFLIANDTFKVLLKNNYKVKVSNLLAKEKMCLSENKKCTPENCIFARDYYNKIKDVIEFCLVDNSLYDEKYIKNIAWRYNICPFELSLDLSNYCDYIVCDYNYCFHPTAKLKRYFESPDKDYRLFFLVDEAHNLVSRSRDMYSAELSYLSFLEFEKAFKKEYSKSLKAAISNLKKEFKVFNNFVFVDKDGNDIENLVVETINESFIKRLKDFNEAYTKFNNDNPKFYSEIGDKFSIEVYRFLTIYDYLNDKFRVYLSKDNENIKIKIICLDASDFISNSINQVEGALFFSGTLSPIEYYEKTLLNREINYELIISSPFDPKNFNLMVNNKISLLYSQRVATLPSVIELIQTFVTKKVGNYMIFAPSFEYLKLLKANLKIENTKIIYQNLNMNFKEKTEFLENFVSNPKKTVVGVAVIGGSFAEGIDLVNDKLIGLVCLGIGLPSFNFENNLLKEYFDLNLEDGYEFAYVNPGINHVMQAVGRLIRTENDRGSALLIDTRYLYKSFSNLYKKEWQNYKIVKNKEELSEILDNFYKS